MDAAEFIMFVVLVLLVGAICWGVIAKVRAGDLKRSVGGVVSTALTSVIAAVGLFMVYAVVTSY